MTKLGLERGVVKLIPHQPKWKNIFEEERKILWNRIGIHTVNIEHIGSTAIPGIVAKPIIDILVGVKNLEIVQGFVSALEEIAYQYKGENGIPGREFFGKGTPRIYHLHIVKHQGQLWQNLLFFRDYLKKHTHTAQQYSELKLSLAAKYPSDRKKYTEEKTPFINSILTSRKSIPHKHY